MGIDQLLDSINVAAAHTALSIFGALVCVYVAQLTSSYGEDDEDPWFVRHGYRVGLLLLALSFCWIVLYADSKSWLPWPPYLFLTAVIDGILVWRAVAIHYSISRRGGLSKAEEADSGHRHHHREAVRN